MYIKYYIMVNIWYFLSITIIYNNDIIVLDIYYKYIKDGEAMDDKILDFLIVAKRATYAGKGNEIE